MEFVETLLIASIPAIIAGIISFLGAKGLAKSQINQLEISNKHDIQKLMEQHKVDINALKEKHHLELEVKDKEHEYKLEIIQKEHENEMIRNEKEQEHAAKYGAMGNIMSNLFGGANSAIISPEIQKEIGDQITSALKRKKTTDS